MRMTQFKAVTSVFETEQRWTGKQVLQAFRWLDSSVKVTSFVVFMVGHTVLRLISYKSYGNYTSTELAGTCAVSQTCTYGAKSIVTVKAFW